MPMAEPGSIELVVHALGEQRMPNMAAVLKEEISRLARREIRSETTSLKKASTQYKHYTKKLC